MKTPDLKFYLKSQDDLYNIDECLKNISILLKNKSLFSYILYLRLSEF